MSIKRIVPNIKSETPKIFIKFYEEFMGLKVAMDMDWIITFVSKQNPTSQISVIRPDESDAPHPDISIEVDDVDHMYARAQEQKIEVVYPITDEPWGVRRFFVKDPSGRVVNILSHR